MIVISVMFWSNSATMTDKISLPERSGLLRVLSRWNRWGTAELASGIRRDILHQLGPFLESPEIVALVGPRRAGKTTVLFQIMDQLEATGVPLRAFLHINLEEQALAGAMGPELLERLYETYRIEVYPEGRVYLLLDEVQQAAGWERWVRSRNEIEDIKIFVTGSSAKLMSPELATLLTGRHISFRVLPLDFREHLRFRGIALPDDPRLANPMRIEHELEDFLRWGGFPEVVLAQDEYRKERLLKQYFDDMLFKDVALRHQIRDLPTLRNLAVFLLGQTGSLISAQRLARIFSVSLDLARTYCGYLEEAFLISLLPFYTLKTGERLRRPQKVYAIDTGLRNVVSLTGSPDRGRLMETAVHGALDRAPHDGLFYWKDEGEIDFVVRRGISVSSLVQVASEGMERAKVRDRELRSLEQGRAAFPEAERWLVLGSLPRVRDETMPMENGSHHVPLWRYLVESGKGKRGEAFSGIAEPSVVETVSGASGEKQELEPRLSAFDYFPDPWFPRGGPGATKPIEMDVETPEERAKRLGLPGEMKITEELIWLKVGKEGSVNRRDIAEMFSISPARSSRALARMVKKGYLVRRGAGRATRYEAIETEASGSLDEGERTPPVSATDPRGED